MKNLLKHTLRFGSRKASFTVVIFIESAEPNFYEKMGFSALHIKMTTWPIMKYRTRAIIIRGY